MKTRFWVLFVILMTIIVSFTANFFMNLYHYGNYLKIEDGYVLHCIVDNQTQFCDNTSIRMMELLDLI